MKEVVTNKGLVYELTAKEATQILDALREAETYFLDKEQWTHAGNMYSCIFFMENPGFEIAEERIKNRMEKENEKMNVKEKVLRLAMQDVPNKLIAEVLDISENSVRNILELRKTEDIINDFIKKYPCGINGFNEKVWKELDKKLNDEGPKFFSCTLEETEEDDINDRLDSVEEKLDILEGRLDEQRLEDAIADVDCTLGDRIDEINNRLNILESKYKTIYNTLIHNVDRLDKTIQNNRISIDKLKDEVAETDCRLAKHIQSISIYFGDGKDDENE